MTSTTSGRGRPSLLAAAAAFSLAVGAAVTAAPVAAAPPDDRIPGSWIVTLVDGPSPQAVADEHRRDYGADVAHVYRHALHGYAARMSDAAVERISRDSRVRSVVADRTVSIAKPGGKPGGGGGGTTPPPAQVLPTGIERVGAVGKAGASAVTVAVIDTGIDGSHPDLAASIRRDLSTNCSSGNSWSDGNGHGTHVAGTIGAIDNSEGVVGVAPGVSLAAVRVLNNAGSGSWSSIICGLDWVTGKSDVIQVANMSLGGGGSETGCTNGGLHQAICAAVTAGVTVVVAAGNSSDDAANHVPAAYDEVITVSALADFDGIPGGQGEASCRADVDDTFASFSNYGADVDLIAPGVCIESTWKGGGYSTISGTSMAAPHVAGAAALWISQQQTGRPTVADVRKALLTAATLDWDDRDDPDDEQERLLSVAPFGEPIS